MFQLDVFSRTYRRNVEKLKIIYWRISVPITSIFVSMNFNHEFALTHDSKVHVRVFTNTLHNKYLYTLCNVSTIYNMLNWMMQCNRDSEMCVYSPIIVFACMSISLPILSTFHLYVYVAYIYCIHTRKYLHKHEYVYMCMCLFVCLCENICVCLCVHFHFCVCVWVIVLDYVCLHYFYVI